MNVAQFTSDAPGRLVPVSSNQRNVTHAFIPAQLPPNWTWPQDLWPLLVEARAALAGLNGTGRNLSNPAILLRPLERREAQLSSKLEGTITEPRLQALFDAEPEAHVKEEENSYREVFNYQRALLLSTQSDRLPLSLRLIRELHAILLRDVRGQDKTPGEFRREQVQIGRPARFVPAPSTELMALLDNLERFLHMETPFDPLVKAFLVHYQFEAIHPFCDGNGRVGRLLLSLCIAEWCKCDAVWLHMSAYYEENRDTYFDRLLAVSTEGDWKGWIEFCLEGVLVQAADTERRCRTLLDLQEEFRHLLRRKSPPRLMEVADQLFRTPTVSVVSMKKALGVEYQVAKKKLETLVDVGILEPLQGAPQASYFCPRIYLAIMG